jgi:dienelactone hydrolase
VGMTNALDGWGRSEFTAGGRTRAVFTRGSGPGVIVIHEIPGITPKVVTFANDVVSAGFTVVMPSLVGTPGRAVSTPYGVASMLQLCIAREFTHWALQRTSPIIAWLRALAADLHRSAGGPGVGAVGMCFSGGFALGMMVDTVMVAPVLSQPSLPLAMGKSARRADLNLSPADAERVAERAAAGCEVLGLRFDQDKLVGTRFDSLRALLGDAFIAVELPSTSKRDHSVLTEHRDEASVERVINFLQAKLRR